MKSKEHRLKINTGLLLVFICCLFPISAQSQKLGIKIDGYSDKLFLSKITGEKADLIDSTVLVGRKYSFDFSENGKGLYRITFDKNNRSWQSQAQTGWIDFIHDGTDVKIDTGVRYVLDSLKVIESESNNLFYSFLRLNKEYKTKTELLQLILARYPKDDSYYADTKKRLLELQNEYIEFINVTAQKEPQSFVAKYIYSSQLPIIDSEVPFEKHLDYLKSHSLDYVNFNDASLINSDLFTNKTIEYLTYFRNPQLPKELLEKEFMKAVDTLLNKAKVNQLVYQHITEYLIDGFKKFGFDTVLDYIVENYVIKDDLCLDVKTEGLIKRRIEHARNFKIGAVVPNIILLDINGKQVELKKINVEKAIIVFYASWCPHCKELLPKLNELKKQKGRKLEFVAISLDDKKEDWVNFVKANCPDLINVSDLKGWDGKVATDYFIYATPTMLVVDKERKIVGKPMEYEQIINHLN